MNIDQVHNIVLGYVKKESEILPAYQTLLCFLLDDRDYLETAEEFFMEELNQTYYGWNHSDDVSLYQKIISGMMNIHPEMMDDIQKLFAEMAFFDDSEMEEVD